jgi:hypothetical protein
MVNIKVINKMSKAMLSKVLILLLVMLLAIVKSNSLEISESLDFINNDEVKSFALF